MNEVDFLKHLKEEYNIALYDPDLKEYVSEEIVKLFYKKYQEDKMIDEFKESFKNSYDDDIDSIMPYLAIISLFSGDFTGIIYEEMLAIIDKIKEDAYSTDRDGFIKFLKEENNYHD